MPVVSIVLSLYVCDFCTWFALGLVQTIVRANVELVEILRTFQHRFACSRRRLRVASGNSQIRKGYAMSDPLDTVFKMMSLFVITKIECAQKLRFTTNNTEST